MDNGKLNNANMRLKRTSDEEEPPSKHQRLFLQNNDQQHCVFDDCEFENSEINEQNYDKISAMTINKKLQVLEVRDRLSRISSTKQSKIINVDDIKPMKGTCLDMCPEKERLMRIHSNMVSQFECKTIDSKLEPVFELMVKQYARSSADQANPLSHELRPTPVLVKTMKHMLKNIIYPIESKVEQDLLIWYDFCWDRLRAIRKDIVQQNLQNLNVVTILEQIGRFHIACYDLMLGYSGFDIKLNTENLNNCIQMLMPMYRELEEKCPNEPEFVSYELLMHLGNPQFHTTYDLLPIHIKQTPEVRFCIKAHTVYLHSGNCREFFRLLKSTTFMNCSILQRIIPSIRNNSIKMMNISFTTMKRIHKLDMKYIMEQLCFNDIKSAYKFCTDVQLNCTENYVELSRNVSIHIPEHKRQQQELFIVQKRQNLTTLISKTKYVSGDFIVGPVKSSFNSNGRFIGYSNYADNDNNDNDIDDNNNDDNDNDDNDDNDNDNNDNDDNDNNDNDENANNDIKNDDNKIITIINLKDGHSNSQEKMEIQPPPSTTIEKFSFENLSNLHSMTPAETPASTVSTFQFNLPKPPINHLVSQVQTPSSNFEIPEKMPKSFTFNATFVQSNLPSTVNSLVTCNSPSPLITYNYDLTKPSEDLIQPSLNMSSNINSEEKVQSEQLTKKQIKIDEKTNTNIGLAKIYFDKWQNNVNNRKSKCIEEVFAHSGLFNSECISSLSSSQSSEISFNYGENVIVVQEESDWVHRQYLLAEKYFYIWLKKVLRKRRKYEMEAAYGMPWSMFMLVHGTPKEILQSGRKKKIEERNKHLKTPINHPLSYNRTKEDDISFNIANIFVKNVLEANKAKLTGNKIFWKLAVNYGSWPEPYCIQDKVQAIIYGKMGFSNKQVQSIYTDYNMYFIKSVQSCSGLHDWKKSGLNASLIFTNTNKENMETLFKRLELILHSTPKAIPCVLIFSSSSNKDIIKDYESVLDAYRINDYINNYTIYIWDGPKTILEAIEFFSLNYVDHTPNMRTENLFYNLLNFAQSFYLKVRNLLPEDKPNIIIEKYNQYLDIYIGHLGRKNKEIRYLAPELIPYYTRNPEKFSIYHSNFNIKYFEELLNFGHLSLYKSWPPQNVDSLIEYIKNMCQVTNRRCWCLDILQMLQLNRKSDLEDCLLNANWYEIIEMWIQGALDKCSAKQDNFTVFYTGDPIAEVLKTVFPDC
ncbi:SAC3/GANP/THP3 [Cinara cedri]|uniref:SAC3/GANP/THP3 n=1 Tax=Cinara cedri TaxID=506608 RepID=A0A5E4MDF2_9HEMI|nr:SAC3/GANP/THP3 [Cinara cedri]